MDKLRDKYEAAGQAAVDAVKLTDEISFEASMGIVPDMSKGGMPVPGWWFTLQLAHNKLLGQPPLVGGGSVPGVNLDPEVVKKVALKLLEETRRERDQQNAVPAQQLPAGLKGLKL